MSDKINPNYYSGRKCLDIIAEVTKSLSGELAFDIGTAVKYIYRFKGKNGIEDLMKAKRYIDFAIDFMESHVYTQYENDFNEVPCCYCKHFYVPENTEPCISCRKGILPSDNRYPTAPILFELDEDDCCERCAHYDDPISTYDDGSDLLPEYCRDCKHGISRSDHKTAKEKWEPKK